MVPVAAAEGRQSTESERSLQAACGALVRAVHPPGRHINQLPKLGECRGHSDVDSGPSVRIRSYCEMLYTKQWLGNQSPVFSTMRMMTMPGTAT